MSKAKPAMGLYVPIEAIQKDIARLKMDEKDCEREYTRLQKSVRDKKDLDSSFLFSMAEQLAELEAVMSAGSNAIFDLEFLIGEAKER